ncbi:GNAT family N-acetyltransferase [Rossellomorea sp. AcN35-11]|nr:GNAT family N-acetyltransferase [Rossellomorea aquimaris]NMH70834.1 GNAT family N-acetyltransferase [Bacillus sp. RO3]WJV30115.1 GNAT family N-acetyltransferase [Rossellomorea sp. AcN35-11]
MKIEKQWIKEDSDYIRRKLIEYNMSQLDEGTKTPLEQISFVIRNDRDEIIGGVVGEMFWHHMHIDFLWVDEDYRDGGYGSKLILQIEEYARGKGCHLILLDTFSFQAPHFYKKLGYTEFGVLRDFPKGYSQHFMEKRL